MYIVCGHPGLFVSDFLYSLAPDVAYHSSDLFTRLNRSTINQSPPITTAVLRLEVLAFSVSWMYIMWSQYVSLHSNVLHIFFVHVHQWACPEKLGCAHQRTWMNRKQNSLGCDWPSGLFFKWSPMHAFSHCQASSAQMASLCSS